MAATVVPIRKCGRCGELGAPTNLALDSVDIGAVIACERCIDLTYSELGRVKPVFDTMLACGIDRDIANEVMTVLLEKLYP